jgi:sugar phosphate isomerase/epimerase
MSILGNTDMRVSRRAVLGMGAGAFGAATLGSTAWGGEDRIGKFKQAAALGPFKKKTPQEELFATAKEIGIAGFDLCSPELWPALKEHGLICTMTRSHSLRAGLADPSLHEECLGKVRESIDATAAEGWPNVITFSGNRNGMADEVGLKNSIEALKTVAGYAEEKKVTLCLEFLNSESHKDYMADSTKWNVELVHGVGSERVKVLYDIFHAGMMGEDVIADIEKHYECWGHYHTAGVPGRHELGDEQTLDYPAIMKAIAKTGFTGYVAHEFSPTRDPMTSLREAFEICDV